MTLSYHLLNVFGREGSPLTGNPLCVFESGARLDDAQMQALARQFNLSETVFLQASTEADAQLRIFTPDYELPFAGHPTLGSAYMVARLQRSSSNNTAIRLKTRAGLIPVRINESLCTLTAGAPQFRPVAADLHALAASLGLESTDIGSDVLRGKPLWVNTGTEQLIVPVRSTQCVLAARPNIDRLAAVAGNSERANAYVFAAIGREKILARYFLTVQGGMLEDPATGSACANLGGWWLAHEGQTPWHCEISQGEQIARASTLWLEVAANREISVSGRVCYLGRGELKLW